MTFTAGGRKSRPSSQLKDKRQFMNASPVTIAGGATFAARRSVFFGTT